MAMFAGFNRALGLMNLSGIDRADLRVRAGQQSIAIEPTLKTPDVSGRPQVLLLERLIAYMKGKAGVRFMTFGQIADDFSCRSLRE